MVSIELPKDQMQEQVNVESETALEERHELVVVELGLEEVVEGHVRAGTGDLDAAHAALDEEDADLVRRDGQVDLVVLFLRVALVGDQDALVGQRPGRVFERAEFRHPAGPLQLAFVVVLFGEGDEEAFFADFW